VFRPIESASDVYAVEFLLAFYKGDPYINLAQKMALLHQAEIPMSKPKSKSKSPRKRLSGRPRRGIVGILVISRNIADPKTEPWNRVIKTHVFEEVVETFSQSHPGHPLTRLFRPLVEKDGNQLEREANNDYAALKQLENQGVISQRVANAYLDLLWQRFQNLPIEEIKKMISFEEVDMKETVAGQQILQIGIEQGVEQGEERVLIKLAKKRFASLTDAHVQAIRDLSCPALEDLAEALLDFKSLKDLENWLERNKPPSVK